MKLLTSLFVASAVLAAGANSSLAQSTSGPFPANNTIPSTSTDWGAFYTDPVTFEPYGNGTTENLNFPLFNSALGTLDEVMLSFTNSLTTTLSITNSGANNAKGKISTSVSIAVQDPDSAFVAADEYPEFSATSTVYTFTGLQPGNYLVEGPLTGTSFQNFVFSTSQVLSEFTGPGTINLSASTCTQTEESGVNGNISVGQVTSAGLTGRVTYLYTPTAIPEPSTFGLLALGLTALPFLRRKRQ